MFSFCLNHAIKNSLNWWTNILLFYLEESWSNWCILDTVEPRDHLSSAISLPKYQKFPSQITLFGTSCKQPLLISGATTFRAYSLTHSCSTQWHKGRQQDFSLPTGAVQSFLLCSNIGGVVLILCLPFNHPPALRTIKKCRQYTGSADLNFSFCAVLTRLPCLLQFHKVDVALLSLLPM